MASPQQHCHLSLEAARFCLHPGSCLARGRLAQAADLRCRDERHWLRYFPPKGMRDIKAMGAGVDERRTFITTDENPFYDAFIRWQFEVLRRQGRVIKAVRCAVIAVQSLKCPCQHHCCWHHSHAAAAGHLACSSICPAGVYRKHRLQS